MLAKGTVDRDEIIYTSKCVVCSTQIGTDRYVVVVGADTLEVVHRDCHDSYITQSKNKVLGV